jgi:hypothetical protein
MSLPTNPAMNGALECELAGPRYRINSGMMAGFTKHILEEWVSQIELETLQVRNWVFYHYIDDWEDSLFTES